MNPMTRLRWWMWERIEEAALVLLYWLDPEQRRRDECPDQSSSVSRVQAGGDA